MRKSKWLALLMAVVMVVGMAAASAFAEGQEALLAQLDGTYDELFPTICAPEYDEIWLSACAKYAGEEDAQTYADMLKGACVGTIYGQEAVDAYAAAPESAIFDCYFLNDVAQFKIAGNQISGLDESGSELFSHAYRYIGDDETLGFALYQSEDADSGAFTYFAFAPDTPAETYHIEFRYGDNLEDMSKFYEGEYAYWLAAAIPADASLELVTQCIDLFCQENLTEGAE